MHPDMNTSRGIQLDKQAALAKWNSGEIRKTMGLSFKDWLNRQSLFSRYDQGIQINEEEWYSVTPEKIAKHQAQRCIEGCRSGSIVLDAFCGVGSNAIQFALHGLVVVAVDDDAERLQMARHNARIYGVDSQIEFILSDSFEMARKMKPDVVFVSPPWGKSDNAFKDSISLKNDTDLGRSVARMLNLIKTLEQTDIRVLLYLPHNTNLCSMLRLALSRFDYFEVEITKLNGSVKAVTVYLE